MGLDIGCLSENFILEEKAQKCWRALPASRLNDELGCFVFSDAMRRAIRPSSFHFGATSSTFVRLRRDKPSCGTDLSWEVEERDLTLRVSIRDTIRPFMQNEPPNECA